MHFKGQLLIPNERGPGLRVDLDVAAHHLALETESGGLGAWPLEVVDVRRLQGDVFAMTVAGEDLHFVADDALSFAYSGVPAITSVAKLKPRGGGFRSWFSKIWGEAPESPTRELVAADPAAVGDPTPVTDAPAADEPVGVPESDPIRQHPVVTEPAMAEADQLPDVPITVPEVSVFDWEAAGGPEVEVLQPVVSPEASETVTDLTLEDDRAPSAREDSRAGEHPGCPAVRSDGLACQSPIITSSGFCIAHDPEGTVARGYQAAYEARARLKEQSVARLNRVYRRLDKAMRQVERGELDPEIAKAMAQLARTMCAILDLDQESDAGSQDPTAGSAPDAPGTRSR